MNNQEKQQKYKYLQLKLKQIAIELKQIEHEKIFIPKNKDAGFVDGYYTVSTTIDYIADMM